MKELTIEEKYNISKLRSDFFEALSNLLQMQKVVEQKQSAFNASLPKEDGYVLDNDLNWVKEK